MKKIRCCLLATIFITNLSLVAYGLPKNIQVGESSFKVEFVNTYKAGINSNLVQYSNEFIAVNLDIPIVSGLKNNEIQKTINDKIQNTIMNTKNTVEKMAKEEGELNKNTGYDIRQYNVTSQYNVTYNKGDILTIVLTIYQYTGGAHGSTNKIAYNFDLNTGNFGLLSDFFGKSPEYRTVILKEIKSQMMKEPEKYFPDAIKNLNGIPYNQNFYLQDDGVIVYFGEYAIAPYVSGIPEFKINYTKFPKGLSENITISKDPLEVYTETFIKDEGKFQSYLSYPIIKDKNEIIINKINKHIREDVFNFNTFIKNKASEDKSSKEGSKVWGASTYFKSYYVNKDLLSIVITYSGNNGTTENYLLYNKGYNINLSTGKFYKLKDVFIKDFDFISFINKEINEQISTLEKNLGHSNIYKFKSVNENTEFYIENGNLIITFSQGEIAPKEYYNPEFTIPLSRFENNINTEFTER